MSIQYFKFLILLSLAFIYKIFVKQLILIAKHEYYLKQWAGSKINLWKLTLIYKKCDAIFDMNHQPKTHDFFKKYFQTSSVNIADIIIVVCVGNTNTTVCHKQLMHCNIINVPKQKTLYSLRQRWFLIQVNNELRIDYCNEKSEASMLVSWIF